MRAAAAAAAAAAKKDEDAPDFFSQLKEFIGFNLSGQRRSGRIILIFLFALNIGSFILYLLDANKVRYEKGRRSLEICLPFMENTVQKIDLTLNICFFMHFIARLIITDNYLLFWFELFSIVDILTIPPAFLALFLGRSWLGLRFSRCLTVLALKDVLQYVNILRSSTAIRLCQLVTFFAGLVLSASGFVHLLENSGDPPHFDNPQDLSYFDCLYLCIVTVATVGYGDFTCRTIMGRAFMIAFILVALAVFANAIPEIADIVNSRTKYGGTYVRRLGKPHLVLCGHITFNTVKNFLSDFLHKDREDVVTQIVILDQQEPNLELQGLLKRYENQVHFFQVSCPFSTMHIHTLRPNCNTYS
ncbi:unnamed protein product [Dibothriocephalus latus]|uniref:BK channel n=1 Tax=Dibothriocephalus latus TaxID=60516 RepID=A0A3P7M4W3_DIBLA|nr:unnamed protein product [Dibothriocephalus latus]